LEQGIFGNSGESRFAGESLTESEDLFTCEIKGLKGSLQSEKIGSTNLEQIIAGFFVCWFTEGKGNRIAA
jgi:hypothetical protein